MLTVREYASGTDVGRRRSANEDAFLARPPVFAVADGMGGAQAGEVASKIAIEELQSVVITGGRSAQEQLAEHVLAANQKIYQLATDDPDHAGMGTTLTAVFVDIHQLVVAHVGDSRLYRVRDGVFTQVTDDHSLVEELLRQKKITQEEARTHPQRSVITKALGPESSIEADLFTLAANHGDLYLLCSDGLTGMIDEKRIHDLVQREQNLSRLAKSLIEAANAAGGSDNITVVLFRIAEEETANQSSSAAAVQQHTQAYETVQPAPTRNTNDSTPSAVGKPNHLTHKKNKSITAYITITAILLMLFTMGAYTATQAVFFIGVDRNGFVTVFQGVPYSLPGDMAIYRPFYHSGVAAVTLPDARRKQLLNHQLRSRDDVGDLVRKLERGEIE